MSIFQSDFSIEELRGRRDKVCDAIGEATAIIPGAPTPGSVTTFRQDNDFYYLCGVEAPHAYLAINGASRKTTLFLPRESLIGRDHNEKLISADDPEYALETTGVDAVQGIENLQNYLCGVRQLYSYLRDGEGRCCTAGSLREACRTAVADPWDGRLNRGTHFISLVKARHPGIEARDLDPITSGMRMTKSPKEIELLRRAGQLTALGLCDAMRATQPGIMEYQVDAILRYHYVAGGAGDIGYHAICASGENAWHGHYSLNNSELKDGDLILVDCGPDYHYYTSDITRVWPVNGTYTPAQRALYGFVTEYHKTLLQGIRPGRTLKEIEEETVELMRARVGEFDFASDVHAGGAEWMFNFGQHLSHSVGMSVHDGFSHMKRPLEPGIVFSVDPQLRVPEEQIYLRVEDTGVVTEDGFDVFTKDVPIELDEIEAMMKEGGILQSFPPLAM